MSAPLSSRKLEHIRILQEDAESDRQRLHFDRIRLKHRALPEMALDDVDPAVEFMGKQLSFPLLISSMTGGDHTVMREMNQRLAEAAEAEQVAMAVGSQRVLFDEPGAAASFELRPSAPTTLLFGNLGAVQLNCGFGPRQCRRAVDVLQADGLFLHLNPLQEAVQPEGDTCFGNLAEKIGACVEQLDVPVVIKEVGAGISDVDGLLLKKNGVKFIDVAGSGGTSWSRIEQQRKTMTEPDRLGYLFQDWGIPTPEALMMLKPLRPEVTLLASGGLRSGVDMAKAMVLGASLCGMAKPFLGPARESADAVRKVIRQLKREFVTALFLLGERTPSGLADRDELLI